MKAKQDSVEEYAFEHNGSQVPRCLCVAKNKTVVTSSMCVAFLTCLTCVVAQNGYPRPDVPYPASQIQQNGAHHKKTTSKVNLIIEDEQGSKMYIGPELFGVGYSSSLYELEFAQNNEVKGTVRPLKYAKGPSYVFSGRLLFTHGGLRGKINADSMEVEIKTREGLLVATGTIELSGPNGVGLDAVEDMNVVEWDCGGLLTINPNTGERIVLNQGTKIWRYRWPFSEAMLINGDQVDYWNSLVVVADPNKLSEAAEFLTKGGFAIRFGIKPGGKIIFDNKKMLWPVSIRTSRATMWDDIIRLRTAGPFMMVTSDFIEKAGGGDGTEDVILIKNDRILGDDKKPDATRVRALFEEMIRLVIAEVDAFESPGAVKLRDLKVTAKTVTIRLQGQERYITKRENNRFVDLELRFVITQSPETPGTEHELLCSYVNGKWAEAPLGSGGIPKDGWFTNDLDEEGCRRASSFFVYRAATLIGATPVLFGSSSMVIESDQANYSPPAQYNPPPPLQPPPPSSPTSIER